ncbi:HyaD/HybD family hydrogenase maturation endopeptidase [Sulfurimonas sp.]|uniref:HyaD/HybD family hydrogenase maturation endopeptidase n=1 Tax=Sulfurimonas sp. TaxID=2022749 RepID=UPI0025F543F4|nr:HyaD/HybD family hydrogenase maturation endopeptidase [Sulfurimonas sp.]MCK9472996.1 HyaD/HybD family hydrogenase maturation endopeptidase [Sulfurimonas sp.]MDD3506662.1 HyaD/HybD family hydrogenase maturation endopeptidase [Sulfurimonas sp.]
MKKVAVIGIGNLLFCDDGIGVIAAEYLRQNFTFEPKVDIVEGGTLGFGLYEYFTEYENVLILDTLSIDADAGEIYKIPSKELLGLGGYKKTAHEVEVVQMLEICELHETKAEVTLITIVAKDLKSTKIGLSKVLQNRFELFIKTVIDTLEDLSIKAVKKSDFSVDAAIKELVS